MKTMASLLLLFVPAAVTGQVEPRQLDRTDPAVRKMILNERKSTDCAAIYQQTRRRFDAQLKAVKAEASVGIKPETLANLTEVTTALGQKRREFCEFYKVDPELTKDDYYRVYGELAKAESDLSLMFRYATGKTSKGELASLQTVAPKESDGAIDVNATLQELLKTVDTVNVRVQRAEERATAALTKAEQTEQQLAAQQAAATPKLHFSQKVITPFSMNGTGEKVIEVSISTDRPIVGAIIGIVCSGPVEDIKAASLKGAGGSSLSYARVEGNSIGVPRENIVAVAIQMPAAFLPGQELIAEVRSKEDVSVVGVTNVQIRPQN